MTQPSRDTWTSRLALRHLLVLIIVFTVGTVIGIHDIAAYRALRDSATAVASQRLTAAVGQIGQILDAQSVQLRRQIDTVAKHSAVAAVLRSPTADASRRAALAAVQTLAVLPTTSAAIEITDPSGTIVLSTAAKSPVPDAARRDAISRLGDGRAPAVGPGVVFGDSLFYATVARVSDGATALGYVLHWRRLSSNEAAREQLIALIGPGTDLAAGNTTGPGWTDFDT